MRIKTRIVYLVLINNTTFQEIAKSTVTCLFDFTQVRYLEGENDQFGFVSVNKASNGADAKPTRGMQLMARMHRLRFKDNWCLCTLRIHQAIKTR